MKSQDLFKVEGTIRIQVKNQDGTLVSDSGFMKNGITYAGLAAIAALLSPNAGAVTLPSFLELGTSNTAFSASQTALVAAITDTGLARAAATVTRTTKNQTNDTVQLDYTWTASGAKTIQEIGVFNNASGSTPEPKAMFCRALVSPSITTVNGQLVIATYKLTIA